MKIVIVEDEIKTLQGIKTLIDGLGECYHVVGVAQNGKNGMELILRETPDIVITDIQMPFLSGLEMIREVSRQGVVCKYIILSGHADFQYAREALKLGSFDYLLKPITQETLIAALERVKEAISNTKREDSFQLYSSEELFEKVILNKAETKNLFIEEFSKRLEKQNKQTIILVKSETSLVSREMNLLKKIVKHHLTGEKHEMYFLLDNKEGWILIEDAYYAEVWERIHRIYEEGKVQLHSELFYAVVDCEEIIKIYEAMQQAENNIQWNLSFKETQVITEALIENMDCCLFRYPTYIEREIVNKINAKNLGEIEDKFQEFITYITNETHRYTDIKEALICLTVAVLYSIRKASYGIYQEIGHLNILDWVRSRISVGNYVTVMMNVIMQFKRYQTNLHNSSNPIISKVIQIIEKEYTQDINLDELARRFHITPEYLSSLFIKEIGVKFTSYCTQKRIEEAKIMLQNGNTKVYEVAEAVGYSDVRYFCKVFKKYTGVSPSDFMHLE